MGRQAVDDMDSIAWREKRQSNDGTTEHTPVRCSAAVQSGIPRDPLRSCPWLMVDMWLEGTLGVTSRLGLVH